jgi:hypothetical protein
MAYSDFTYLEAKRKFGLSIDDDHDIFATTPLSQPSAWLAETLEKMLPLALAVSTEKARSEWIISPILVEVRQQSTHALSLFSGTDFTVEASEGLSGFCDFILTRSEEQNAITAPVLMIVEAKNENMKAGLGQCLASMVAAQRFNEREGNALDVVYGAVTTGTTWRFLRMQGSNVEIDRVEHYVENIARILGIFQEVTS